MNAQARCLHYMYACACAFHAGDTHFHYCDCAFHAANTHFYDCDCAFHAGTQQLEGNALKILLDAKANPKSKDMYNRYA